MEKEIEKKMREGDREEGYIERGEGDGEIKEGDREIEAEATKSKRSKLNKDEPADKNANKGINKIL